MKAETDFRDLLRHPEKLFGYSFLYLLAVLVMLGMLYAWNLSDIGRNSVTAHVPADSTAFVADIPMKSPAVLPPVDVMIAGMPSERLLTRGRDLYRANCSSCHGDNGMGDGPAGATMNPKPRSFHTLPGWTNGSKVSQIYRTLEEGIVRNGMASYSYLPPEDRFALAHVVRAFTAGHPADTPEDLQALETAYQLSKGKATAGQIPVQKAMQILVKEGLPASARISEAAHAVTAETADRGALVLKRTAGATGKVLGSLLTREIPDLPRFVSLVSSDPLALGFTPAVLRLTDREWKDLHDYLISLQRTHQEKPSS